MASLPTDFFTPAMELVRGYMKQLNINATDIEEQQFGDLVRLTLWRKIGMTCSRAGAGFDKLFPVGTFRDSLINGFDSLDDSHIKIVDAFIDWLKTVGEYKACWCVIKYNSCANDIEFIPSEREEPISDSRQRATVIWTAEDIAALKIDKEIG